MKPDPKLKEQLLMWHHNTNEGLCGLIDLETEINLEVGSPSAYVKGTHVVLGGTQCFNDSRMIIGPNIAAYTHGYTGKIPVVLVGHNVSFDTAHSLMDATPASAANLLKELASGKVIQHDTQDMEYILSGHQETFGSLDTLAENYGVTKKKDTLKTYLDAGKNVPDIPVAELTEYLKQDLDTTMQVVQRQAELLPGTCTPQQIHLAALRRNVTTIMMHNGMPFDKDLAMQELGKLEEQIEHIQKEWDYAVRGWWIGALTGPVSTAFEECALGALSSPKKLHTLLYGGALKYTARTLVGAYKNGKPKFKNEARETTAGGYLQLRFHTVDTRSTDESSLQRILDEAKKAGIPIIPQSALRCIELLLEYRKLSKVAGTYIGPLLTMVENSKDGRIHPSLNTTATHTGRLSSSKPNAQNMPSDSPVKGLFREDGWTCIEGDYKQLEMIALALKSGDKQLMRDLEGGVDIHYEVGKQVFGWTSTSDMTKETRRLVKSVDFGLVYGGGAKTLAAQSGADVGTVQNVIDSFFKRYPGVFAYHKKMEAIAKDASLGVPTGVSLENGASQRRMTLKCDISGRRYTVLSYASKYGRKTDSNFSPTELKNYLVQGLATADFVPFACSLVAKAMAAGGWMDIQVDGQPKAKLCNTVHDSIMVWVKDEYAEEFAGFLKATMEYAWPAMFDFFSCPAKRLNTQVVAEISMGPSWGETKEVQFK